MLGKQAWKMIHTPSALGSQLPKGSHFPRCDFWHAGKRARPSWEWQNMLMGRHAINPYVRRALEMGKS